MKILWISDCPDNKINTGYATATRLIAVELMKRGYTFVFGSQGSQDANVVDIMVGTTSCKSYGFGKGKFLSSQAVGEIDLLEKPDLIVTMADWQMVENMMGLSGHAAFSKWVCYAPVDGDMLTDHWDFMMYQIPFMVYMSPKFGPSVGERRRFGFTDYVPLPIDMSQHFILPDTERAALRRACKEKVGWPPDTKSVLTVARNQWRKNYPEIIKAAAILKNRHHGKFSFILHCCPVEPMGWDLPRLIQYYDVDDCVAISEQQLGVELKNQLFNSADLFLLPSMGEGFGIPIVEAALYELPIFTTHDTANKDLTDLLECSVNDLPYEVSWQCGPTIPRPFVGADVIANCIDNPVEYDLKQTRRLAGQLFNIKTVASKWEHILHTALNARRRSCGDNLTIEEGKLSV